MQQLCGSCLRLVFQRNWTPFYKNGDEINAAVLAKVAQIAKWLKSMDRFWMDGRIGSK